MIKDVFKTLEFDKILARLRDCATSNFGKELAEKILEGGGSEMLLFTKFPALSNIAKVNLVFEDISV